MSTLQVDLQLPQRFGLEYIGADNERHRPVMIHRALFGSVERFFGVLVEHYAGAFPMWLAPVQARVLPVRDDHEDYAAEVTTVLRSAGLRVEHDAASEPLGARIRRAKLEKLPYVLVVGDDDVAAAQPGREPVRRGLPGAWRAAADVPRTGRRRGCPARSARQGACSPRRGPGRHGGEVP